MNSTIRYLESLNPLCGFSTGGVNVWGDKDSIDKVRKWNHSSSIEGSLREMIREARKDNESLNRKVIELQKKCGEYQTALATVSEYAYQIKLEAERLIE